MNWIARLALRLYPAWWRQRYGTELQALVEDSGATWRTVLDLGKEAMAMQLRDLRSPLYLRTPSGLRISFSYPDEDKARRVVDDLTGLFIDANVGVEAADGGPALERFRVTDPSHAAARTRASGGSW